MKTYLLVLICFLGSNYFIAFAQDQIAVHISPGIAFGRVYTEPNTGDFSSTGAALRGKVGVMYDWNMRDNYYLSAGIALSAQQVGFKNTSIQKRHEIQCLQLPILLKLYTSELELDLRGYVQIGFIGALKINNRVTDLVIGKEVFVTNLRMWGVSGLLGFGVEYNLSLFTSIFGGFSYQLGLSSMLADQKKSSSKLYGYEDLITLDVGIRF